MKSCEVIHAKEAHFVIKDNDGHTYLIPSSEVNRFWEWVEVMESPEDLPYTGPDFDANRIDGTHVLEIYSWRTR